MLYGFELDPETRISLEYYKYFVFIVIVQLTFVFIILDFSLGGRKKPKQMYKIKLKMQKITCRV